MQSDQKKKEEETFVHTSFGGEDCRILPQVGTAMFICELLPVDLHGNSVCRQLSNINKTLEH